MTQTDWHMLKRQILAAHFKQEGSWKEGGASCPEQGVGKTLPLGFVKALVPPVRVPSQNGSRQTQHTSRVTTERLMAQPEPVFLRPGNMETRSFSNRTGRKKIAHPTWPAKGEMEQRTRPGLELTRTALVQTGGSRPSSSAVFPQCFGGRSLASFRMVFPCSSGSLP